MIKKQKFEWGVPAVALAVSGWFVAGYFAYIPAYERALYEVPAGTTLNIVTPYMYLYIAVITNAIAWLIAMMFYFKGDEF